MSYLLYRLQDNEVPHIHYNKILLEFRHDNQNKRKTFSLVYEEKSLLYLRAHNSDTAYQQ
jgi:hypothetical protein